MTTAPKPSRLRVAGYVRTSSDEQERTATHEAQITWLEGQAALRGWDLKLYVEAGVSGETLAARPKARAVLEGVRAGRFDVVAVRSIDRLCRSQGLSDWAVIADTFKAAGVTVAHQGQDVDLRLPEAAFMFTVLGPGVAGLEKSMILARTKAGADRAIRAGRKPRGVDPFGYRHFVRDHRWEVVAEEAETVRRVFALALEGLTTWEIEERLRSERRFSRRGAVISRSAVHRMLRGRTYRGEWKHAGGTVLVPELVDEETWQRAQHNRTGKRAENAAHFLAGVVRCADCDLPAHVVAVGKARHAYLRCASTHVWYQRKGIPSCRGSWRRLDVETVVWQLVTQVLSDPSYLEACRPRRKEDPAVRFRSAIEAEDRRIAEVEAKLRGATLRWSQGLIPDGAYDTAMGTLGGELALSKERQARAARDLAALEALRAASREAATTLDQYRTRLASADVALRRKILAALCPQRGTHGVYLYADGSVRLRGQAPKEASKGDRPASWKDRAARLTVPFEALGRVGRPRRAV